MVGILLVNLGSPTAPTPVAVGAYLREFLMDEYVIDIPKPLRWALVNLAIVPRRKYTSAKLYQSIWTEDGSPLLVNAQNLADALQQALGDLYKVSVGMRYGEPSIQTGLSELISLGVDRVVAVPLYPQYAESSFETAVQAVKRAASVLSYVGRLEIMSPFYNAPEYLDAVAHQVRQHLVEHPNAHVLFSYHSLPERHIKRLDVSGEHCLQRADCCDQIGAFNARCYRAHCVATTRAIAERLALSPQQYSLSFQSRLGRQAWLGPQTEAVLPQLAQRGIRQVAVTCPSFVADCLETLEEIAIRARAVFLNVGGQELTLVPALNVTTAWVKALTLLLQAML